MSGIIAIYKRDGLPVEPGELQAMLEACPERGVDGQSLWISGHIGLANQHFWITPEEKGERQPLVGEFAPYVITSHARLDNRLELMGKLGISISENRIISNAQLILGAYRKWGLDCPCHLLGDFSFVIWDPSEGQLFIARDQMGAGDISYYLDAKFCLVASQVTQILAHPVINPRINEGRVAEYLADIMDNHIETFYERIYNLPPAHSAVVSAKEEHIWRYWNIDPDKKIYYKNDDQYAQNYLELLTEAVRCRIRADGGVGLSLSGGLDSSALAAIAAPLLVHNGSLTTQLKSFSYVFNHFSDCDERKYIQPLIDRYSIQSNFVIGDNYWPLSDLESWPVNRETPIQDIYVRLPLVILQAAKKEGCRLLLSGQAGDLLYNEQDYWFAEMVSELRIKYLVHFIIQEHAHIDWHRDIWIYGIRQLVPPKIKRFYHRVLSQEDPFAKSMIHPDLVLRNNLAARKQRQLLEQRFSIPGRTIRYQTIFDTFFSEGFTFGRQMANAYGIEFAYPFFDQRVVEFIMALPADQLGRPSQTRWILRNALGDRLPQIIRDRSSKTDFSSLFEEGVYKKEKQTVKKLLHSPQILKRNYIRSDWLQKEMHAGKNLSDSGYNLWKCISLELWLNKYWQ